jgi:uncharacterized protein (DUF1697 family)
MPEKQVALLRGINVGGKNKLPMRDLVAMFVEAGCEDVSNFIQSGNVIFRAAPRLTARLPVLITAQIATKFGHSPPVILRTTEQLRAAIADNPFMVEGVDENALYVMFLAEKPSAAGIASLDPNRSPPDIFKVLGQEIYLNLVTGAAKTKLTNDYFDRKLATTSTARNWRTVNKLLELMQD